jgi:hypothetical protein
MIFLSLAATAEEGKGLFTVVSASPVIDYCDDQPQRIRGFTSTPKRRQYFH